jgi:hypothetical protein
MARSARVSVKLTVDKKKEFETIAERYGVSASMLGACILGHWMDARQEENKRLPVATAGNYGPGAPE